MGRSRRSISVTSPPASRAAAAATRTSFLLNASLRVVPANARILAVTAGSIAVAIVYNHPFDLRRRTLPGTGGTGDPSVLGVSSPQGDRDIRNPEPVS